MPAPLIAGALARKAVAGRAASVGAGTQTSQIKSQFQQNNMNVRRPNKLPQAANSDEEQEPDAQGSPRSQFMQMSAMMRQGQAANDNKEKTAAATAQTQDVAKDFVKSGKLRGIMFLINGICAPFEAGSGGLGLIFTFIPRIFALGYSNLEMIYGTWIMKGKHKFIPATSWKPISVPIDPKARFLQLIIIMTDILILFVIFLIMLVPALIVAIIAS